ICDKKDIPMNDTIKIDSKVHCSNCFETHFSDQNDLEGKLVEKEIDPTICSSCSKDFGNVELNKISTYPICSECETTIKNKTFPSWVKGFFIAILVIVVASFIWNWKFYSAYSDIKKSNTFFQNGDYSNATSLMRLASQKVPEVEDIKSISIYFNGIDLLSKDKCSEALKEFEKCKEKIPADYDINTLIIQAKIGSTFENKDYNGFLEASKENLDLDTTLAISLASVASAYACIYADKGKEDDKLNALKYLEKAKQIDSTSQEMKTYYNMLDYRIYSHKIIKREEFIKQFPNGWTK
ncbi:hypothetical protein E3A20_24600, partial [Planctomyces bekefii]